MKRTFLIIGAGVLAMLLSQALWFQLRAPVAPSSNPADLAWLKSELRLNDEQYTRICEIHRTSGPRLSALASQVAKMRSELEAFENQRRSTGEIDFLEFARFVELRRAVDLECRESTRRVVDASANQMTPEQRTRYLEMVSPMIQSPQGHN